MGFMRKALATAGLAAMLSFPSISKASVFNPLFDETNPYSTLEGRMVFSDQSSNYLKWMDEGLDELGFFLSDGTCIGSTMEVSDIWDSHYDGLKVNDYFFDKFVDGELDVYGDLFAKAYNADTGTIWNAAIMGYSLGEPSIHVSAIENTGEIPEPATLALLGVGALALASRRKRKYVDSKVADKK